ncbi:MAG: serine/threonine-protein kinase [Albidovulum sp.]
MAIKELAQAAGQEDQLDELQPGTTLLHGQYTITRFLNNGGFGITYLAKDSLDREVVIKECFADAFCRRTKTIVSARSRAHQGELKSIIKHFIQEARSLSKLVHPNIVGVHQVFEDNDTAYMAIDYVDGKDLMDLLEDPSVKFTPTQIVDITRKMLAAVGFVHDHGLLHRDISPDNILVNQAGEPILIDFGAAREHISASDRKHTALRVVKDGYSPQEFYIAGSEQGPWSDLYALAASLYHLIKGEAPINGQQRLAALAEQRGDPYQPLTGNFKGYPAGFLEAIDKAMITQPTLRLQSAAAWLEMLENKGAAETDTSKGAKKIDGNPDAAIAKLLTDTAKTDTETTDADTTVAAKDKASKPFAPLSEEEQRREFEQEPKGRGLLMAGSGLALVAVLGLVGYSFMGADETATTSVAKPQVATLAGAEETSASGAAAEAAAALAAEEEATRVAAEVEAARVAAEVEAARIAAEEEAARIAAEEETARVAAEEEAARVAAEEEAARVAAEEEAARVAAEDEAARVAAEEEAARIAAEEEAARVAAEEEAARVAAEEEAARIAAVAAQGPILEQQVSFALWDVAMPFKFSQGTQRNAEVALITDVSKDANLATVGSWLKEGTEIYTVNETPLSKNQPLEMQILNAMVVDPDGYTRVGIRYKDAASGRFDRALLAVPVVRKLGLADGTLLEVRMIDGNWATTVTEVPTDTDSGLKVGDILESEITTAQTVNTPDAIELVMSDLVRQTAEVAAFQIMRDGTQVTLDVPLAR